MKSLEARFEEAIHFLCMCMKDLKNSPKPTIFHSIRVGTYLYNNNYNDDVVLAGLLHDVIEDTVITKEIIEEKFNATIAKMVMANSRDSSIDNKKHAQAELITRCILSGKNATIIKAADILDNYIYYKRIQKESGILYCFENAEILFKHLPNDFSDKVFDELKLIHK